MKEHMQTIINFCFAIFITMYIIQNDRLNDKIDLLETENQFIKDRVGLSGLDKTDTEYWTYNQRIISYGLKTMANEERMDTIDQELNLLANSIDNIEEYLTK